MNYFNEIAIININNAIDTENKIIIKLKNSRFVEYYCLIGKNRINSELIRGLIKELNEKFCEYLILFNNKPTNLINFLRLVDLEDSNKSFIAYPAIISDGFYRKFKIIKEIDIDGSRPLYFNSHFIESNKSEKNSEDVHLKFKFPLILEKDLTTIKKKNFLRNDFEKFTLFYNLNQLINESENFNLYSVADLISKSLIKKIYEDLLSDSNYSMEFSVDISINNEMLKLNKFWNLDLIP